MTVRLRVDRGEARLKELAMRGRLVAGAAVAVMAVAGIALPVIGLPPAPAQASGGILATTYMEQPGYPVLNNTGTTVAVTTAAVGDVMLVMAHTAPSSGTSDVASITDGSGRVAWQSAKSAGFTNHPSGDAVEIWYGVVKSVGPTTIDVHWAGTTFDHFVWAAEWSSGQGATTSWSVVSKGAENGAVGIGTTCAFPPLTTGSAGGLYWGWAYGSAQGSAGHSPGFSYYVTTAKTHQNVLVSALAADTTAAPTFVQAAATSWYDAAAVVMQATGPVPSPSATGTGATGPGSGSSGYDMVAADGGVFVFPTGQAAGYYGSLPGDGVSVDDVVGMVATPSDDGYFLVGADGGVFAFGDAPYLGSLPGSGVHVGDVRAIVGTSDNRGYFLVGADGGVFAFGDAPYLGSLPGSGVHVDDVVGIAATPDDDGYWLVTATGQVDGYGDAVGHGSVTGSPSAVSGIESTPDGQGYWVVTQNGSVYAFGDAAFLGSLPQVAVTPTKPVVELVPTADRRGYWLIGADGGIFSFGDATFDGSLPQVGVHVADVVGAVPTT